MRAESSFESREPFRWRDEVFPLGMVIALAALFFFAYFNRFAGLRSGDGEYAGGMAFLAGRLPYRDYFTSGPPMNQLKSALELAVFGKALIVSRAAGLVERLLIAALLYGWLRTSFGRCAAAVAAFVTIVVSAGDRTDPLASYNHDSIFFAMLCGFAATLAIGRRGRHLALCAATAGCAAGLSALTKQTVGIGTMVGVLIVGSIATGSLSGPRRAVAWAACFLAGATVPLMIVGLYLRHLGVLSAALNMVLVAAPKAKAGHPLDFLTRSFAIALDNWPWVLLATLAMLMSSAAVWRSLKGTAKKGGPSIPVIALWGFALVSVGELLALTTLPAIWNFSKGPVYYTLAGTAITGVAAIVMALRRAGNSIQLWRIALFATVGWCVAFSLSLSWPAFEAMALPGLALLMAASVEGVERGRPVLYALLGVTVFFQVREKLDLPFSFDAQDEPAVRFAVHGSKLEGLRGMRLPAETLRLLERTTNLMQARATGDETVFTYPEMSLVYTLSGRNAPTLSGSHNIDTTNDVFAREEANRLLTRQPVVILYARPTEQQLKDAEATWRHGARSGQRDLMRVLDCLTSHYELRDTFQLQPQDNPIRLYAKPASSHEPVVCARNALASN